MCKGMIGKKLGMTSVFLPDGRNVPVTVIELGPCVITQIKKEATDGYNALQLGFGEKKESHINKPIKGHIKKSGKNSCAVFKEFPVKNPDDYTVGQVINWELFDIGESVNVTGTTKGRGFSGVMKRHGFSGGRISHGSHSVRIPGSVGCSAWPSKIVKGKKMPGHYGNARKTVRNLKIIDIRPEENLMLLKGAVPGSISGVLTINKINF